jgi:RNA polymerase sigma-70 factor (ECF subfamily)
MEVADGNQKAFEELFYAYHNQLGSYVMRWTKSTLLAEEVVQEVFLKIWINREALKAVERFDNYLYIVSRNHTFNALRQTAKNRLRSREWARHFENDHEHVAENLTEEYMSLIDAAVARLAPQQQKVYILKRHGGLKYEEIANQLGISPETARKHLAAALKSITSYVKARLHVMLLLFIF